jgi:hypothetical protein
MTDLTPTPEQQSTVLGALSPKIGQQVEESTGVTGAVAGTLVGAATIVAGAVPVLAALVSKHDVVGFATWVQSSQAAQVGGAVILLGGIGWRTYSTLVRKLKAIYLARKVDDKIGVVKS